METSRGMGAERAHQFADCLRELHRLNLRRHRSLAECYRDYLETGCRLLGMSTGIVSRIQGEHFEVLAVVSDIAGFVAGDVFDLGNTYSSRVVELADTVTVSAVGRDSALSDHPVYLHHGLESYAAAPIWVFDRIHGTLNFTAVEVRDGGFCEVDIELLEMMALNLGRIIERDLTEREREAALARMNENIDLFESAFIFAGNGKALVSLEGQWLRVNPAAEELLGYSAKELLDIDFQQLTHPDDLERDLELLEELLAGKRKSYRMEKRYTHKDGHTVWAQLCVSLVRYANGRPRYFIAQLHDISDRKLAERQLEERRRELEDANRRLEVLATVDELTGVRNRRAFDSELARELAHHARIGSSLSLLLLDVDHFKAYNDDFGHSAGDRALVRVAKVLQATSRQCDLVARYGGEEFAIILPDTDAAGCLRLAERLRREVAAIEGLERDVTASVGCCTLASSLAAEVGPLVAREFIDGADRALYRAKAEGRNRVCLQDDPRAGENTVVARRRIGGRC